MTDPILYHYAEDKNPDGAFIAGVPLRSLRESDVEGLPTRLKRSIAALPFYIWKGRGKAPAYDEPEAEAPPLPLVTATIEAPKED